MAAFISNYLKIHVQFLHHILVKRRTDTGYRLLDERGSVLCFPIQHQVSSLQHRSASHNQT